MIVQSHSLTLIWPQRQGQFGAAPPPRLPISNSWSKSVCGGGGMALRQRPEVIDVWKQRATEALNEQPRGVALMRESGKNKMCGKGGFRKGVIIATLKQELWIGNTSSHWAQDEEAKWACARGACAHSHAAQGGWNEPACKCRLINLLLGGQGLAVLASGEFAKAWERVEGSGTEHARLLGFPA